MQREPNSKLEWLSPIKVGLIMIGDVSTVISGLLGNNY